VTPRILILGGTREAAELAERLVQAHAGRLDVVTSLAGRTARPRAVAGTTRIGGFGGADGLADYIAGERIAAVIDATHPFAAAISTNAAAAAERMETPRLLLLRSAWQPIAGDQWIDVADLSEAAAAVAARSEFERVFLAVGSGGLDAFRGLEGHFFLIRAAQPVTTALPGTESIVVVDRGPFTEDADVMLMRRHRIGAVVSKNAGGAASYAKIAAARTLGLPVIMVRRPPKPAGETVASVDEALDWIARVVAPVSSRNA
jgi:precorrin-6A/cobalt-precorrin-6A reductase